MKKVALHGRSISQDSYVYVKELLTVLAENHLDVSITQTLDLHNPEIDFSAYDKVTEKNLDIYGFDVCFSLGGDGTFLDTLKIIGPTGIPILGVNTGRLGFLATIAKDQIKEAISYLLNRRYRIENRSLLALETDAEIFDNKLFALNEFTILRKETSSMIVIKTFLNGDYLTTYWADGLMVATPTGSTGYSLSCGGPIMLPDTKNFILTPVSPHNLNIRPLIVPDESTFTFEVESRNVDFLVSLDSRSQTVSGGIKLKLRKADFTANLIKIEGDKFVDTLRNKLSWGLDKRN